MTNRIPSKRFATWQSFAVAAIQGLAGQRVIRLPNQHGAVDQIVEVGPQEIASFAAEIADSMLAEVAARLEEPWE